MGGVDHFDHLLSSYSIAQKSRKWWIKIFYFLLDSVMVNSFILYRYIAKQNKQKVMKHLMFRRKLGAELIGNFTSRKTTNSPAVCKRGKKVGGRIGKTVNIRNVGEHFPVATSSRRYARCSTTAKHERSSIECSTCKVALCKACFAPFHSTD
ncbi:hypothetical protein J6590_108541 [Homalodisca vitripennis]|nr:hypothetical protein J6590_108541 [Homalodisca vitripennis]